MAAAAAVVAAAGGLATGLALAGSPSGQGAPAPATGSGNGAGASSAPAWLTSYTGYETMMERYESADVPGTPGPMMSGSSMMSGSGMMGGSGSGSGSGSAAPRGYGGIDMGRVMGAALAAAPGPRTTLARAEADASARPAGAVVDGARNQIVFTTREVRLTLVTGLVPAAPDAFEAAGLADPAITVPAGARVTLVLVNADPDSAHGLVVAGSGAAAAWMPMMTAAPAFPGAAVWVLGDATAAGAPSAEAVFTAASPGSYAYLCPVPGSAQQGMSGSFTVG